MSADCNETECVICGVSRRSCVASVTAVELFHGARNCESTKAAEAAPEVDT